AIVAKAVETASPLFERRRQMLDVRVPDKGLTVLADPVRLSQVIANLLTNAAKFSDLAGHVAVEAHQDDGHVTLSVRDRGVGIPAQDLQNVFEPFVQGGQTLNRPHGGLGLGLAIARSLANLHGGTLDAESEGQGKGSTFRLRLPLASDEVVGLASVPPSSPAVEGEGLRVLVVDDNEDAASTIALLLSMWGYSVQVAHDGPSALRLVERSAFDIGLLDIGLPVMDGYELARLVRKLAGGETMRLIALTGYGHEADQRRSFESGFDWHLVKPVEPSILASMLEALPMSRASL
ncbi:MAG TPA: ATP-binding protein, partial [Xanthomonadaceae bacterium]|nr:ATP-binding protein [Xanthomonadaceae bacterium]